MVYTSYQKMYISKLFSSTLLYLVYRLLLVGNVLFYILALLYDMNNLGVKILKLEVLSTP